MVDVMEDIDLLRETGAFASREAVLEEAVRALLEPRPELRTRDAAGTPERFTCVDPSERMTREAMIREVGIVVGTEGVGAPAIVLEARGELIPIFVAPGQAQTIEAARQGMPPERPLTHDLFVDVLADLDATLDRVRIDDLADETYYAKLDLTVDRGDDRSQIVRDARPSDGIALAVRVDCPITVADAVIDEAGHAPDHFDGGSTVPGTGAPAGAGMDLGFESDPSDTAPSEEDDLIGRDEGVDIDIDEPDDADDDDDSPS